ncbi:MAG: hypothetical protein M3Y87_24560 [Myxococcota bacterium]|nr:hypothetical protein [Myxococcota bacterium]
MPDVDAGTTTRMDASTPVDSGAAPDARAMMDDGGPKPTDAGVPGDGGKALPDAAMPDAAMPDAAMPDGAVADSGRDGSMPDAAVPATCPDQDLGMAVGIDLATGSTIGAGDDVVPGCGSSSGAPDLTFAWTAPAAGTYTFDTGGSTFDTILQLRSTCGGTGLDCNDDRGSDAASLVRATLAAGESVVIELDGYSSGSGDYYLSITSGPVTEVACFDGTDDDRDGNVDCNDYDCDSEPGCIEVLCSDGVDNDGDFSTDCDDFDCRDDPACIESSCTDGVDNDGDTAVDCDDYDCRDDLACIESDCGDGLDNDGDMAVDCDDFDCDSQCNELVCDDGIDDDMDGAADCADTQCSCDAACISVSCPDADLGSAVGNGVAGGVLAPGTCSERSDASCGSGGAGGEILYRWTAPAAGTYVITTEDTSGTLSTYDTMLYVLDGSCSGMELACNDDSAFGLLSSVSVTLTAGQTVIIVLDAYGVTSSGDYVLNINAI